METRYPAINRLCLEHGLKKPDIMESGMFVQIRFYRKEYSLAQLTGRIDRTKKVEK